MSQARELPLASFLLIANMAPDRPQLFIQYPGVESIEYYRKGGFHPIHIDDVL